MLNTNLLGGEMFNCVAVIIGHGCRATSMALSSVRQIELQGDIVIYELEGRVMVADGDYFIADNASVIGSVLLHNDTSVWFGAVVRGDNEPIIIGAGSNVQEHCVLHTDLGSPLVIGRDCTIGHKAVVHGCKIGDNSLIGIGAIVLNDATIGKNCLIGAGALVSEGKVIPDGSLVVGAPGKVIRQLTAEQIEGLTVSAQNYVRNFKRYKAGFKPRPDIDGFA
jgi:carbonic anhydrase/acetyltransferase-like protein (isoleucine patch superfamily)